MKNAFVIFSTGELGKSAAEIARMRQGGEH